MCYSPRGRKDSDTTERLSKQAELIYNNVLIYNKVLAVLFLFKVRPFLSIFEIMLMANAYIVPTICQTLRVL